MRIAVAESCTGGLIASRLTDVPGSSRYVDRAFVTYSNESKTDLLGVPEALIAEHGAVSEAVALAMAHGARDRASADIAIGVTGIAGPGGGTAAKPVGTVAMAVATTSRSHARTSRFIGAWMPGLPVGRFSSLPRASCSCPMRRRAASSSCPC